jgi:hypothetical protein
VHVDGAPEGERASRLGEPGANRRLEVVEHHPEMFARRAIHGQYGDRDAGVGQLALPVPGGFDAGLDPIDDAFTNLQRAGVGLERRIEPAAEMPAHLTSYAPQLPDEARLD